MVIPWPLRYLEARTGFASLEVVWPGLEQKSKSLHENFQVILSIWVGVRVASFAVTFWWFTFEGYIHNLFKRSQKLRPLLVKGQVQSVNTGEDTLVLREATGAGGHQVTVDSLSSSPGGCGWLRPGQYVQVQWCKYSLNIFPLSKYFPCPGGGPIGGRGQAEVQQDNQLDPGQTLSADVGPRGRGVTQCPYGEDYYQWYLEIFDKQSVNYKRL